MKKYSALILLMTLALALSGCSGTQEGSSEKKVINVSAAASLKGALTEIEAIYESDHPDQDIQLNFGGSGALQAQIEEGAPADVFISAGTKQADELEKKGFIKEGSRKSFLRNTLVVITSSENDNTLESMEDLAGDDFPKIGHSDPALAPVGQYASEAIKYYSLTREIAPKTVLSPDVKTTLAWVESGEADAGFVYMTDAMSSDKVKVAFEVDSEAHSKIEYPAVIIRDSLNPEGAVSLMEFISQDEALDIFRSHGFVAEAVEK